MPEMCVNIYEEARKRSTILFEKILSSSTKSKTTVSREEKRKEWNRKSRANYVAKNRDKIREKAREYYRRKHPGCKIRGEYKHKEE